MSKLKQFLFLYLFAATILSACSKNESPINEESEPGAVTKTSIIIAGSKFKPNANGFTNDTIPTYWVDGVEKELANVQPMYINRTTLLFSKTGKIHFFANSWVTYTVKYWIDGVAQTLPSNTIFINAALKDDKLHMVGSHNSGVSKYWIDGVEQPLPGEVKSIYDVVVADDKVYMAGANTSGLAMYWVNGVGTALPDGKMANRIIVSEGKTYIVGTGVDNNQLPVLKYWINGVKHDLPNSRNDYLNANMSIAVSAGKVYIVSELYPSNASRNYKYWIDGVEQSLPQGTAELNDVAVLDGKVHLVGSVAVKDTYINKATYWIDGVAQNLPNTVATAVKIGILRPQ
jgi:hypothetical protein